MQVCRVLAEFTGWDLLFAAEGALFLAARRTNRMNVALIALGCILMELGLLMQANRSGYLYFVVGPRSILILAAVVAVLAFWIHGAASR
jgi:hypothetical protein